MTRSANQSVTRPANVPDGWTIYHASEAGAPDLHGVAAGEAGEWHYQPDDAEGNVWSDGYATWEDALRALLAEIGAPQ